MCKSILILLFSVFSMVGYANDQSSYRTYLHNIDNFQNWFRVGSYNIKDENKVREVDIYYWDSGLRPDGKQVTSWTYPNLFGLYCVWKTDQGKWTHKEIAGSARVGFHQIVSAKDNRLILELRGQFIRFIEADETAEESKAEDKMHSEANKPFKREVIFKDGVPDLISLAEQDGADQPATAPELKLEGNSKPQTEAKVCPR
ncbi:MAG: hypothetical protein KJO21_11720 [Verrucomicrobiae bacterium]|nr:hypothetical protein [Verrucomicrobiae bacterium]NNJ43680.1 hypothetical protein [Akkermansiaceae bacterium]